MMYDREKSDPAIVAVKPTNKAGQPAAELVEPRAGAEGNVSQQSTGRAQYRGTAICPTRSFTMLAIACDHGNAGARPSLPPQWENIVFNRYLDLSAEIDGLPALSLFMSMRAAVRAHVQAAPTRNEKLFVSPLKACPSWD